MWITVILTLLLFTHNIVTNPKFDIRHGFGYEDLGNINFIKSRIITYRMIDNSIIFDGINRLVETGELLNRVCGRVEGDIGVSEFLFMGSDERKYYEARAKCRKTNGYNKLPEIFHRRQLNGLTSLLSRNQFAWLDLKLIGRDRNNKCIYQWETTEVPVDMTIFNKRMTYPPGPDPDKCLAENNYDRYAVDGRQVLWTFTNDRRTNNSSHVVICQKDISRDTERYHTYNQCKLLKTHWANQSKLLTDRMETIYGLLPSTMLSDLEKRITNETELIPYPKSSTKSTSFKKGISQNKPKTRPKRAIASIIFAVFRGALSAYTQSRIISKTKDNGQRISALQIDVQDLKFKQAGLLNEIREVDRDFQHFKITSLQFDQINKHAESVYNSVTLSLEVLRDIVVKTIQKQASALVISPTIIQKLQNRDTSRDRVRLALEYDRMSSEVAELTIDGIVIKTIIPGYEYMPHKIVQIYSFPSIKEQAQIKLEYSVLAVTHDKTSYIPLNYLFVRECKIRGCEKPFNNIRSQFELCGAAQYFDLDKNRAKCEWAPYQHNSYLIKTSTGFAYSLKEKTVITVQCPGLKAPDVRIQLGYAGHLTLRDGCQTTIFLNSEAIPLLGPIENVEYVINGTVENLNVDEIESDIHVNTIAKIEKVHVHNTQSINMTFYIAIASAVVLALKIALLAVFMKKGFQPFKFIMAHREALAQLFIDVKREQQLASAPAGTPPSGGNSPTSEGSPRRLSRQESRSYGHFGHKRSIDSHNVIIPLQAHPT